MPKQSTVRRILIKWDEKGRGLAEKTVKSLTRIDKSAKRTAGTLGVLKGAFAGYLGIQGVRTLTQYSDTFQLLRDRMSVFTGSTESANAALKDLQGAAAFTRSSVAGLAESYNRIALSTKDLGLSTDAILGSTIALQQTFRLSGSTLAEATASTIQLSQGLAAGALRGQELRSVLEANAVFGGLLAKEFKVTRGELIKLGETGRITSDKVLKIMAENFEELNLQAGKLSLTFEQAFTISLDKFKLKVFELNEALGISKGLAGLMVTVAVNAKTLLSVLVGLSVLAIPALIVSLKSLYVTLSANPIGAVAFAFTFALSEMVFNTQHTVLRIKKWWAELMFFYNEWIDSFRFIINQFIEAYNKAARIAGKEIQPLVYNREFYLKQFREINAELEAFEKKKKDSFETFAIDKFIKALKDASKNLKLSEKALTGMAKLNRDWNWQLLTTVTYLKEIENIKLEAALSKFEKGKSDLVQLNAELTKMSDKLRPGAAIFTGFANVANGIESMSQGIADGITSTFSHLEDSLVEFVKNGKFEFSKFTAAVLDDLNRIIIRSLIIKPLASAILGSIGGAGGQTSAEIGAEQASRGDQFAKGGAFSNGVRAFASGGVIDSPTLFSYNGGKTGLMGEAGSEAIVPLSRTSNGDLGVKAIPSNVNINVINSSGSEAEVRESRGANGERNIDVFITKKVRETVASGKLDSTLQQRFGLARKGN